MPRYLDFLRDVESIAAGVVASSLDEQQPRLQENLMQLAERWVERAEFKSRYGSVTDEGFVDA